MIRTLKSRDRDDAADVVQDAFLRLSVVAHQSRPVRPVAYLQRIVRNLLIDRARRARREGVFLPLDQCELPPVSPDQESAIAVADLMHRYERALATLTPRTRRVFLMHRLDDMSYVEIARRLDITVATVEYHMGRALTHLDTVLEE